MKKMKKKLMFLLSFLFLSLAFLPNRAEAKTHWINLSLVTPVQIFKAADSIKGFRFNLFYGRNNDMTGFDLGLVNHITGSFKGVQWGLVGITKKDFTGWAGNMVNIVHGKMKGLQLGAFNYAGEMTGLQLGIVNYSKKMVKGIQIGLLNIIGNNGWLPFMVIVNGGF